MPYQSSYPYYNQIQNPYQNNVPMPWQSPYQNNVPMPSYQQPPQFQQPQMQQTMVTPTAIPLSVLVLDVPLAWVTLPIWT